MWPYDYFNQFSALELDSDRKREDQTKLFGRGIEIKRKAFIAMWFGEGKSRRVQTKRYEKLKENLEKLDLIVCSEQEGLIDRELKYRLEALKYKLDPSRADEVKKGDLLLNILNKIISSRIVICDITPRLVKNSLFWKTRNTFFPENVMFELGLAAAWKMPEQVIILWDKKVKGFPEKVPFDIKTFHIDFGNPKEIDEIIHDRLKDYKNKKDILIKNIKCRLDHQSIDLLARRNGLIFFENQADSGTIRHLLNLRVIRTEIFPPSGPEPKISFGYCLTEIGKIVLKELGINLHHDIIIDMHLVRQWIKDSERDENDRKNFNEKKDAFFMAYGINWDDAITDFCNGMLEQAQAIEKLIGRQFEKDFDRFSELVGRCHPSLVLETGFKSLAKKIGVTIRQGANKS